MAKYITSTDQNVALNSPIPFDIVSIPCNKGYVIPVATGVLNLRSGANQQARYEVQAQANVSIPTGGAVTPVAIGITINGVVIPDSLAIITPAAVGNVNHINTSTTVTVPCGCCLSVSAVYLDATVDDAAVTPTPSVSVRRYASMTVNRTA